MRAPYSAQPWVDRACQLRLDWAQDRIVAALEPFGLRLVFLGGSASLGEAVGWEGETRRVLSDLDLGVLTDRFVPLDVQQSLVTDLVSGAKNDLDEQFPGPELGLGFYETRFQADQDPTPGQVDLAQRGLTIWGDEEWLRRFRAPAPDEIPHWEAFRLVGNRSLELLKVQRGASGWAASSNPDHSVEALQALSKMSVGLWTARTILENRYQVGVGSRLSSVPAGASDPILSWVDFLSRPAPETLPPGEPHLWIGELRRVLVELFRDSGYWPDLAGKGMGPETPYLEDPASIRIRWRRWKAELRGSRGDLAWAVASRLQGTPESRRMGIATLYWLCLPESPEPFWGVAAPTNSESEAKRWRVGSRRLLGKGIEPGKGCRNRVLIRI